MKTFNKTYLPSIIEYKGDFYKPETTLNSLRLNFTTESQFLNRMKEENKKLIICNVLSKNLKGKRDLHGNLYQPNKWYFVNSKM